MRYRRTDQPTDRPTDGWTDKPLNRDARLHQKTITGDWRDERRERHKHIHTPIESRQTRLTSNVIFSPPIRSFYSVAI